MRKGLDISTHSGETLTEVERASPTGVSSPPVEGVRERSFSLETWERRVPGRGLGLLALWIVLAGGAFLAGGGYYSTPAPGRLFHPNHGLLGPSGAVGFAMGVLGCAMIVMGLVTYALRKHQSAGGTHPRSRFTLHAFLCCLGAFYVVLHTGFAFTGAVAVLSWGVVLIVISVSAGGYLHRWLPVTATGSVLEPEVLVEQRQHLLQRLWHMTDVPPERLEALLSREIPPGDLGVFRALQASISYHLRRRRRVRRLRAAVAILEVPASGVSEAMEVAGEQVRLQALLRFGSSFAALSRYWRRVHLPLAIGVVLVLVARLAVLAATEQPWAL